MPAVIPITGAREGAYVLLEAAVPGMAPRTIGVMLADPTSDRGWLRMLANYEFAEGEEDPAEVLEATPAHLQQMVAERGAEAVLQWLEDSLSNTLRISERQKVAVDSFTRVLDRLYRQHVEEIAVRQFQTHLPLYTLRAAAGYLGEEMQSVEEDWVPAPEGMHLSRDLFVAHVTGRSMEPRIPDGSLNVFRLHPVGSRQGKIVLVERFGVLDETARYTVKRYSSHKRPAGDQWEHDWVRLEPLNPEFQAWELRPDEFAVVAEWVRVIE